MIGAIFRGIWSVVHGVLRFICIICAMTIGVAVVCILFIEKMPLGEPSSHLQKKKGGQYIDLHTHVAGIGRGGSGAFVSQELLNSYKYYIYLHALGVSQSEIEEYGDAITVKRLSEKVAASSRLKKAVVLAMDGVIGIDGELDRSKTEIYVPNEFVAGEILKYDNLLFGASVNPYRKDALSHLIAAKRAGAVLVKWIPCIMSIDPADSALKPFYAALIELDLPLLAHTGNERSFTHSADELCDPMRLLLPLKMGVTVIAAHIATTGENGGASNFDRLIPLMKQFPNLYADISSLTQINKLDYLKKALAKPELKGRLLYGSDYPLQFFPLVSPWYHLKHISAADAQLVAMQENVFDRDVLLKKALGVGEDVFISTELLLKSQIESALENRPPS